MPVGPWQMAQRCASVAPLPIDCWLGWASVVEVHHVRGLEGGRRRRGGRCSARQSGCAADCVPEAREFQLTLCIGQHDEAAQRCQDEEGGCSTNAYDKIWISQIEDFARAHYCAPT